MSPTSSFEIEYPVTAYFEVEEEQLQITLYEDGSVFGKADDETFYGGWRIIEETNSKIAYKFGGKGGLGDLVLFSDHNAIFDPESENIPGYWR